MKHTEITVKAVVENTIPVMNFVDAEFKRNGFPMQAEILTAVEEIFINIASYAYTPDNIGEAKVSVAIDGTGTAVLCFKDWGMPYNPLEKAAPDFSIPVHERKIGGLGIHFVKELVDKVEYEYSDKTNILTITKAIGKGESS